LGIDEPTGFAADGSSIPPNRLHFTEVFNSYSSGLDGSLAMRYNEGMILSFKDADTRKLAHGDRVRRFVNLESVARRKLRQIEIANVLEDLRIPPGNHLEQLKGDRNGQYSIRINDQFRICFYWTVAGAEHVEIVDYH
jgi:proteic killer suppression protein